MPLPQCLCQWRNTRFSLHVCPKTNFDNLILACRLHTRHDTRFYQGAFSQTRLAIQHDALFEFYQFGEVCNIPIPPEEYILLGSLEWLGAGISASFGQF